ncbi:MAG: helix-turn-helix transcriptional regulator [Patescibacteria group bacterium]|nr:helix-turn-helix transcriptional regulator [Patescibacteria group bacterium]
MSARRNLSPRQREILRHVCAGKCDKEISALLGIKENTVAAHFSEIFRKLNARSRAHAVAIFLG